MCKPAQHKDVLIISYPQINKLHTNLPFAKCAVSSPNAEAHSLTSAIAASNSGVMSNSAIDKLLVREGVATYGEAGTNAMEAGVRERQMAATEMMDFMFEGW